MRLRFSRQAERDFEQIADYISRDSPKSAYLLVRRLRASCENLIHNPLAHPLWLDLPAKGLRRHVVASYLIFYSVDPDVVEIARVLHGARDVRTAFSEEL